MLETLCLVLLTATLFLMCSFLFTNSRISKKFGGRSLFFLAALFIFFTLIFKPESFIRWDLIEHFKLVDSMRHGGISYATKESLYADLFVYNYFAYFISLLPKNCQNLLTVIPLTVDFLIIGYIYRKTFNKYLPDSNGKTRLLSILLWLFTFGMKLAISGIRCSLAVSIAVLAVYLEMIQKKNKFLSVILYFVAIFIHNFAIAVILIRLLTALKKPVIIMLTSLGLFLALEPLARFIVNNSNNEYLTYSFKRILDTLEYYGYANAIKQFNTSTLIIYACFLFFAIYLFIVSARTKKLYGKNNVYCKTVTNFTATVGAVAIGLSFNYLYLERFMYLISFALLLVIPLHNRGKNSINAGNLILLPIALFVFFFNDIYIFIVNYVGNYFLAF